jgi:plasmid maintenance system antidote protein VapI
LVFISGISSEMALRLSKALGRSPESWLTMQDSYDLWHARQSVNLDNVEKIEFKAAQEIQNGINPLGNNLGSIYLSYVGNCNF